MNSLSWKSAMFVVMALFSIVIEAQPPTLESNAIKTERVKRGLLGPSFGFAIKSSILESLFGKNALPPPPPPVQPVATQPGTLPAAQPGVPIYQPVTQPPPIFPTFLQNIMQAKKDIISGKFVAKQPPAGSFAAAAVPTGSLTLEDVELAEEYVDPATASKNNIVASILKLSGPMSSSSSSVEFSDE